MKNSCIIGYGSIGPVHAAVLSSLDNVNLYGVCDIDNAKLLKCKEEYDVVAYDSFDEVLADKNIDSVHICTPHYLHTHMAISAMKSGKDVVLEKPVGISKEELDKLYKFSKQSSQKLCIMFQNRENQCIKMLKDIVSKTEDSILGICGFLTWDRDDAYYKSADWRGKWKTEGGALMINQAIHLVDLMYYIGGDVDGIKAHVSNKNHQGVIEAEDTAEMLIYYKSGVRGCLYATNCFSISSPYRLEVIYKNVTYRYADNALYKIERGKKPEILAGDNKNCKGKKCWGSSHYTEILKFYSGSDYVTLDAAYQSSSMVYAMYESSRADGKYIKL